MSRHKNRERFLEKKRLNPDYAGFRGYEKEPYRPGQTPMQAITCSVCGRKRNVPRGVAEEAGDRYVCLNCRQAQSEGEA